MLVLASHSQAIGISLTRPLLYLFKLVEDFGEDRKEGSGSLGEGKGSRLVDEDGVWVGCGLAGWGTRDVETQNGGTSRWVQHGFIIPSKVPVLEWPGVLLWRIFLPWDVDVIKSLFLNLNYIIASSKQQMLSDCQLRRELALIVIFFQDSNYNNTIVQGDKHMLS